MKHLIIIHGRSTKPSGSEKERLVKKALLHGLNRVDASSADKIENGGVKCSFAYYGDINNRLMIAAGEKKKSDLPGVNDPGYGSGPCELPGSYDDDLEKLLARKTTAFKKADYQKLLGEHKDRRWKDDAARVISAVAGIFGMNDQLVAKATPDMGAYLLSRKAGSEVRQRLAIHLQPALLAADDVCLVSHSMGCIVAYDTLWKYSQMSEYKAVQDTGNRVSLWLTLGCPLGEPGVIKNLYDAHEPADGKHPRHIIRRWENVAAHDDFVSHDEGVADDFKEMRRLGYLESIKDRRIYNFWTGSDGANPHKFYGYLDHPEVARLIAGWIAA